MMSTTDSVALLPWCILVEKGRKLLVDRVLICHVVRAHIIGVPCRSRHIGRVEFPDLLPVAIPQHQNEEEQEEEEHEQRADELPLEGNAHVRRVGGGKTTHKLFQFARELHASTLDALCRTHTHAHGHLRGRRHEWRGRRRRELMRGCCWHRNG